MQISNIKMKMHGGIHILLHSYEIYICRQLLAFLTDGVSFPAFDLNNFINMLL